MREEREVGGWMSFALGAALGLGLGWLFAPRSGHESRRRLSRWLSEHAVGPELVERVRRMFLQRGPHLGNGRFGPGRRNRGGRA